MEYIIPAASAIVVAVQDIAKAVADYLAAHPIKAIAGLQGCRNRWRLALPLERLRYQVLNVIRYAAFLVEL